MLSFMSLLNFKKTGQNAPNSLVFETLSSVTIVPNSCVSIMWIDEYYAKNFLGLEEYNLTIDLNMGKSQTFKGHYVKMEVNNEGFEMPGGATKDQFKIEVDIFVTTEQPVSNGLDALIGISPCGVYQGTDSFNIWSPRSFHY